MALKFATPIDLSKLELQNARVHNLGSAPGTPVEGQIYFNSTGGDKKLYYWNGTSWVDTTGAAGAVLATAYDTRGDLLVGTGADTYGTKVVGANGTFMVADNVADATTGLSWRVIADADLPSTITRDSEVFLLTGYTTKGDIGVATGSGAVARQGVGADNTFFVANSAQGTGVEWRVLATGDIGAALLQEKLATADLTDWPRVASLDLNSQKIINLLDPTAAQDAATKGYVDAVAVGIDFKPSVSAATTGVLPNTPTYANGTAGVGATLTAGSNTTLAAQDGVTLTINQRLLVKDQASSFENGIYQLSAVGSGAAPWVLTRVTDSDTASEITAGMLTYVEAGTAHGTQQWIMTTTGAIVVGTTGLVFSQFSGASVVSAGAGMTASGNVFNVIGTAARITVNADSVDIAATYVGQSSITTLGTITTGVWTGTDIAVADGGTGASTAAAARTNLGAMGTYTALIGDNASTSIAVTHSLSNQWVHVQVVEVATLAQVICDVVHTSSSVATLSFAVAPATNALRVIVIG